MYRKAFRVLGAACGVALVAGVLAVPSAAAAPAAAPGVSDDEVEIVAIVPDLDALRAQGISFPEKLTTGNFLKRWQGYADAYGPINGRKVVFTPVGWNPTDPKSQSVSCTEATQDNDPFLVVNASGYRQAFVPCITVDNDTPMFSGDPGTAEVTKASGNNLITLGIPSEVAGKTTAQVVTRTGLVEKTAKIGIVSNNDPQIKAAGDALEAELTKRGYDVASVIELNGLASDATLINREGAQAATTMQADGIDTVFLPQSFTSLGGFLEEAQRSNAGFNMIALDGQAAICTMDAATRTPASAAGIPCVTANDGRATVGGAGIKADNEFEAECRAQFDEFMGEESHPGAGNGDTVAPSGEVFVEDFAYTECTMASLLFPAMEKAGKNLTWDKVYKNILATKSAPAAYMSNGEGGFAKNRPYFTNQVHLVVLTRPDTSAGPDANGTFNGCPVPAPCFVPQLMDGQEWYPVSTVGKG